MSEHCYVCSKSLDSKDTLDSASNMFRVTCPRCGTYDVSHKFIASRKHGAKFNATEWLTMSHAIRRATDAHGRFGEPILEHDMVQALVARYPLPDAVEQADIMIDSIARRSAYGKPTPLERYEVWLARIGLMAKAELQSMQEELVAMVKPTTFADDGKAVVGFQLTLDGWKRAREIRKERGPGNQAFVAMWFHPAMDVPSTTALPRAGRHRPFAISRRSGRSQQQD